MMKRRMLGATVSLAAIVVAWGCALTMSVGSHVDRTANFAQYRSFDWGPADALPTGDARLDRDPYFQDYLQGAVERGLSARGLQLASSGTPDLLLHYHANVSTRIDANSADRAYGYCRSTDCPPDVIRYEAGTLILDVIDARTDRLVWRGWAQNSVEDMLDDRNTMAKNIGQAVTEMLRRFPPSR